MPVVLLAAVVVIAIVGAGVAWKMSEDAKQTQMKSLDKTLKSNEAIAKMNADAQVRAASDPVRIDGENQLAAIKLDHELQKSEGSQSNYDYMKGYQEASVDLMAGQHNPQYAAWLTSPGKTSAKQSSMSYSSPEPVQESSVVNHRQA